MFNAHKENREFSGARKITVQGSHNKKTLMVFVSEALRDPVDLYNLQNEANM